MVPPSSSLHEFGAAVRELRTRREMSQADVGTAVYVSRELIAKVETAQRWPSGKLVVDLDQALHAAGALAAFWPTLRAQHDAQDNAQDNARDNAGQRLSSAHDGRLDRAALDWLGCDVDRPLRLGRDSTARVDDVDTAALVEQLADFRLRDHRHGAGAVYPAVCAYLGSDLERLLTATPADDATARTLYTAAAGFWELAGYQAIDLGIAEQARDCYVQALQLATAAGDRLLGGYLLSVSCAHLALLRGDVDESLRMARIGLRGTQDLAGPRVRAAFQAVLARGYARRGDEPAVTQTLLSAEADLAHSVAEDEPAWIGYFNRGYLADEMAHCFHDLGKQGLAQAQADDAMAGIDRSHVRRMAIDSALKSSALARAGDLEAACAVGREAVDYAAKTVSARGRQRVEQLRVELSGHVGVRAVDEFEEYARCTLGA